MDKEYPKKLNLENIYVVLLGLIAFLIYEFTHTTDVWWGDSGEFVSVAYSLGIGHSYGHPLFWLMGRLSIMIWPGEPVAGMNHLVALISAGNVIVVALLAKRLCMHLRSTTKRMIAVGIVSLLYATFHTIWSQAIYVEVYNFQAFFILIGLYFLNEYFFFQGKVSRFYIACYSLGIAITLGLYAAIILLIVLLFWIVTKKSTPFNPSVLIMGGLFIVLGLTLWMYLPVRSHIPLLYQTERINSFQRFIDYLTRSYYAGFETPGLRAIMTVLPKSVDIIWENWSVAGIILFFSTFLYNHRSKQRQAINAYLLATILLFIIFTIMIPLNLTFRQMVEMDVYFIPIFIVSLPVLIYGTQVLLLKYRGLLMVIVGFFLAVTSIVNWQDVSLKKGNYTVQLHRILQSHIPSGWTILPVSDEIAYPLYYQIFVKENPHKYTLLNVKEFRTNQEILQKYIDKGEVALEIHDPLLRTIADLKDLRIAGPFFMSRNDSLVAANLETAFTTQFKFDSLSVKTLNSLDRIIFGMIWGKRAVYFYLKALQYDSETMAFQHWMSKAENAFLTSCSIDDFSFVGAQHAANMALFYNENNEFEKAKHFALRTLKINPHNSKAPILRKIIRANR